MWRTVAATGAPHIESDKLVPAWPALKVGHADRGLMDFSLEPKVIDFPVAQFCEHWDTLLNRSRK